MRGMEGAVHIPRSWAEARAKLRCGLAEYARFCVRATRLAAELYGIVCLIGFLAAHLG